MDMPKSVCRVWSKRTPIWVSATCLHGTVGGGYVGIQVRRV